MHQKVLTRLIKIDLFFSQLCDTNDSICHHYAENPTLKNPLQPCCEGLGPNTKYHCGDVDATTGAKKYSLCEKPEFSLF